MAADDSPEVRSAIASRKDLKDDELFITLSGDEDEKVRKNVAQSENCLPSVLELMSQDDSDEVRLSVAMNKNTPSSVLVSMKEEDPNEQARQMADYFLTKKKKK